MKLKVDTREHDVLPRLKRLGLQYQHEKLDIGDFASDECLFERKTFMDLAQSIVTGHMTDQLERMYYYCVDNGKMGFLVVEGSIDDVIEETKQRHREANPQVFWGLLASALVRYGINIVWNLRDTDETYQVVWRIAEKVHEGKLNMPRLTPLREFGRNAKVSQVCLVCRVSPHMATLLLEKFKSLKGILLATDRDLLMIPGMGPVTLKKIRALIN